MRALPNDSDPGRFLSAGKHPHDDVHPYVAARFAAAGVRTVLDVGGGNGRLTRLLTGLSMRCLLIELSPAMLSLAPRPLRRRGRRSDRGLALRRSRRQGAGRAVGRPPGHPLVGS